MMGLLWAGIDEEPTHGVSGAARVKKTGLLFGEGPLWLRLLV
jgi:hypothetical protein